MKKIDVLKHWAWLGALAFVLVLSGAGTLMAESRVVVMLGDSLTAGYNWANSFPEVRAHNHGIGGDTTVGVWLRLDRVVELRPEKVFLQIGINDLGMGQSREEVIEGHLRIWKELQERLPSAELYVISLLPVGGRRSDQMNKTIAGLNVILAGEAKNRGLHFINLHPRLLNASGRLRDDCTQDGLHLLAPGYEEWVAAIRPFV